MKSGWHSVKLKDIANITMGQSPKSMFYNYDKEGLPFFQGCSEFGDLFPIEKKYCSKPTRMAYENDVLMSVRAPVGDLNIADRKCCIGRGLCAIESKSGDRFVYYLLKANLGLIQSFSNGSTYQSINKQEVNNLPIYVPPKNNQKKISSILGAFDDLIENNTHRIQILEEMAQRIYREWFVHFRYPGNENDKMVDSGTDLEMIPERWKINHLNQLCLNITDGTHSTIKNNPEGSYRLLSCKNIKNGRINITEKDRKIDVTTFKSLQKRTKLDTGDLLVTTVGTIGEVALVADDEISYDFQRSVGIIKPNPSAISSEYLYCFFRSSQTQQVLKSLSRGAAQQCLFLDPLRSLNILTPQKTIHTMFVDTVAPIIKQKYLLNSTNDNLRDIRNLLLPKLISGQIDVTDLDIDSGDFT
jgi:type I restriction enzyme, S subunit